MAVRKLKVGDVLETAVWMDGRETEEMKQRFAADLRAFIVEQAHKSGVVTGPLMMYELKPGDERVPKVPKDLSGPNVRFLVGETMITGLTPQREGNFVGDLEPKDLERLRSILKRVHRKWNPGKPDLSNEKCDEYININGPEAALAALREQVGVKVH